MSLPGDIVLLLTHSQDYFTVDRVAEALTKSGVRPFRLDSDRFPLEIELVARISSSELDYRLEYGKEIIALEQVRAVWMRRIWQPNLEKVAPQFRAACARESSVALRSLLSNWQAVRWVDDLQQIEQGENKLRQLEIAREVGLRIPRTLVTNHPEEVRQFFQSVNGKAIAKLMTPLSTGMEGSAFFVYTSVVQPEDLLEAETLRYSPMIFQEQIPKHRELRVVFVAGNFFVGALDASRYSATTMDWRRAAMTDSPWESDDLPDAVASKLKALMAKLKLIFGAIDLIETPDGEYVFLEVNPTGEWGMLERDLGYSISGAIANALLS
ncbi:MvdC family ATP-grasp ribosomal peptide maturase [Myxosarcina sp. GI1]|uniref:MvdC family ATP-grasp ribosomal peptide maturase n=1 Tax=Myxosarcina sp. GI1 TaxID=1541065 RepID=UPI00055CC737|nr:MvdC family ATP-grasp ribosomal peptide maturase [Myxosarcina sp. GI1]